jgi:hypothetical protein
MTFEQVEKAFYDPLLPEEMAWMRDRRAGNERGNVFIDCGCVSRRFAELDE